MTKHAGEPGRQHTAPDRDSRAAQTIPVLRLDTARRVDGTFDEAFLAGLRAALHGIGFLQLIGYGAVPGQVGALTAAAARFFALPLQERIRLDNRLSPHFRGYTRLGHEITAGRADAREQIDFAPEQAPVRRELWDAPYRLLEGPNQWPDDTVPELRPLAGQWAELLSAVSRELTRAVAAALALPEAHFDPYFVGEPHWFGKLIHYVGAADGTDLQGVGPHTDWNFLTLLLQDDVGGLQARPVGTDRWIDVPPVDGALVVNIGEMLEVATHGYLVATPHRVLPCAPGRTRDSVGFFWAPRLDASLDAVPLPRQYAEQAPGVSKSARNILHSRFGDNALKGWLRSHPEVAATHHADLLAQPHTTDRSS
jgi:isopenicillin N synthase-like dioxygenase